MREDGREGPAGLVVQGKGGRSAREAVVGAAAAGILGTADIVMELAAESLEMDNHGADHDADHDEGHAEDADHAEADHDEHVGHADADAGS